MINLMAVLVQERRQALGLTTQEMADLAGISPTSVSNAELGRISSTAPTHYALRAALTEAETQKATAEKPKMPRGLGAQLRYIREEAGLTQRQVADLVGRQNSAWLPGVEAGSLGITPDRLDKLAAALGYEIVVVPIRKESRPDA